MSGHKYQLQLPDAEQFRTLSIGTATSTNCGSTGHKSWKFTIYNKRPLPLASCVVLDYSTMPFVQDLEAALTL
jgi:hypothetical protein